MREFHWTRSEEGVRKTTVKAEPKRWLHWSAFLFGMLAVIDTWLEMNGGERWYSSFFIEGLIGIIGPFALWIGGSIVLGQVRKALKLCNSCSVTLQGCKAWLRIRIGWVRKSSRRHYIFCLHCDTAAVQYTEHSSMRRQLMRRLVRTFKFPTEQAIGKRPSFLLLANLATLTLIHCDERPWNRACWRTRRR